jgi:hypothetical protein
MQAPAMHAPGPMMAPNPMMQQQQQHMMMMGRDPRVRRASLEHVPGHTTMTMASQATLQLQQTRTTPFGFITVRSLTLECMQHAQKPHTHTHHPQA